MSAQQIYVEWMGRLTIIKMSNVTKFMYKLNTISIKVSVGFLMGLDIQKFIRKSNCVRILKILLKKMNEEGEFILSEIKTYWKARAIVMMRY